MISTDIKHLRKIILPIVLDGTSWGATTVTYLKYNKYFEDNSIEFKNEGSDFSTRTIAYDVNCTDEELLLIKLSF